MTDQQPPPGYPPPYQHPYQQPHQQPYQQPYGYYPYYPPPVPKPTGWFIVNWLFFWPTAIYSTVTHWGNIERAAFAGDWASVQRHCDAVRRLGMWALGIAVAGYVIAIIFFIVMWNSVTHCDPYGC